MNKTVRTVLLVVAVGFVVVFGYSFIAGKKSVFPPISFQETSNGCGNIIVSKVNEDNTMGVSVSANSEKLNLSTTEKTFEIGKTDGLEIEILIGNKIDRLYCTDIVYADQPVPKRLVGKSGKVTISISDVAASQSEPVWERHYTTTVVLKDVHFVEENGNSSDVTIDELIFRNVEVGWLPG